jgi:hypothetical protein
MYSPATDKTSKLQAQPPAAVAHYAKYIFAGEYYRDCITPVVPHTLRFCFLQGVNFIAYAQAYGSTSHVQQQRLDNPCTINAITGTVDEMVPSEEGCPRRSRSSYSTIVHMHPGYTRRYQTKVHLDSNMALIRPRCAKTPSTRKSAETAVLAALSVRAWSLAVAISTHKAANRTPCPPKTWM